MDLTNINRIAEEAQRIYEEKFRIDLEKEHLGEFVVIDVQGENFYVGEFPEDALRKAKKCAPRGLFHLIKVGTQGAFRVSDVGESRHLD